jgi:hypothetical protein
MNKQELARLITSGALVATTIAIPHTTKAAEAIAVEKSDTTANRSSETNIKEAADPRVETLEKYLKQKNSPLAKEANTFIEVADKYQLDWRFLPAIAGMESSFGQNVLKNSYNPFGWGGGYAYFDSWENAIRTVGLELYQRVVVNYGTPTPESLGPSYCPPNYRKWIAGVNFFMDDLSISHQSAEQTSLFWYNFK